MIVRGEDAYIHDDRGASVIQLAPPLISGQAQFDELEKIRRHTLTAEALLRP